jgi:hypothetical protein
MTQIVLAAGGCLVLLDQDYAFIMRIRNGQIAELQEAWTEGPPWNDFWS